MGDLTFEQFAEFIRKQGAVSRKKQIERETQFERDLGITGDDGGELIEATERQFGVALTSAEDGLRNTFNLGPNEFLFHAEGFEIFPFEVLSITGRSPTPTVRSFTVGELYDAVREAMSEKA